MKDILIIAVVCAVLIVSMMMFGSQAHAAEQLDMDQFNYVAGLVDTGTELYDDGEHLQGCKALQLAVKESISIRDQGQTEKQVRRIFDEYCGNLVAK